MTKNLLDEDGENQEVSNKENFEMLLKTFLGKELLFSTLKNGQLVVGGDFQGPQTKTERTHENL